MIRLLVPLVSFIAVAKSVCAAGADDTREQIEVELDADGGFVNKHSRHAYGASIAGNRLTDVERPLKKYSKERLHHAHEGAHLHHTHHDMEAQALLQSEQARRA